MFDQTVNRLSVVSELPDRLRIGEASAWAQLNLADERLDAFLEGPVIDRDGNLFVVDIPFGRILRLDPAGTWHEVIRYDGWPNGLKLLDSGTLLVADHKLGLVEVDPAGGPPRVVLGSFEGAPFHGLNDLTLSRDGDVYFTDQGRSGLLAPHGRVFRLRRSGTLDLLAEGIPSPNGLVLSADERTLFLAVTRANAVWRLPIGSDGNVYKAGLFIQLSGGIGPDGLALAPPGTGLVVAHPGVGVWVFAENGLPRALWAREGYAYVTNLVRSPSSGDFLVTESKAAAILAFAPDTEGRERSQ